MIAMSGPLRMSRSLSAALLGLVTPEAAAIRTAGQRLLAAEQTTCIEGGRKARAFGATKESSTNSTERKSRIDIM